MPHLHRSIGEQLQQTQLSAPQLNINVPAFQIQTSAGQICPQQACLPPYSFQFYSNQPQLPINFGSQARGVNSESHAISAKKADEDVEHKWFETEEEAMCFEEANFDAPVPEFYLSQMTREAPEEKPAKDGKYQESFKKNFKTEMCKFWEANGTCEYEDSCSFAHGPEELKTKTDVPKNYKTKLCKRFHKQMYCPYGTRCQFVHNEPFGEKDTLG